MKDWNYKSDSNGLYPAVPEPENQDMSAYWIRDNYWIWVATGDDSIPEAFARIVQNHSSKIYSAIHGNATEDFHHIHPRYDENLEEFENEWGWLQWDSVGNLLEVLAKEGYSWEATLVYNYLNSVDFTKMPDHGMWEDEKDIHPSSLGAIIRGYLAYGDKERAKEVKQEMLRHLPKKDLATATLLYPVELVSGETKEKIIENLKELEGENGVSRFPGDDWDGESWKAEEPEWTFGLAYLHLITREEDYRERLEEIHEEYGEMPESFVGGEPNSNSPLLWSEALFRLTQKV